jgi:hypothetical protein
MAFQRILQMLPYHFVVVRSKKRILAGESVEAELALTVELGRTDVDEIYSRAYDGRG